MLELIDVAWSAVSQQALSLFSGKEVPAEYWLLVEMFDWFIPLSLDVYKVFLSGDLGQFEVLLGGVWRAFGRMHKLEYMKLILLLLSDIKYWKQHRPDIYAFVSNNLAHLGEEEVELFHSVVRRWVRHGESAEQFLVRAHGECASFGIENWAEGVSCLVRRTDRHRKDTSLTRREEAIHHAGEAILTMFTEAATCPVGATMDAKFIRSQSLHADFKVHLLPCCAVRPEIRPEAPLGADRGEPLHLSRRHDE